MLNFLLSSVLCQHFGTIDIADLAVVPYPDSLGKVPLVSWGIDYNVTANEITYFADSDGGCTFALQDTKGNLCTLILNCHPEDDTCELLNHQIYYPEKELIHKGILCVPDRVAADQVEDGKLVTEKMFVGVYPSK
ncbi:hypothetical protein HDV01_002196 [Terramyces sp. JEL0728]|nr:hypothetical protein HDV01_002196 [Terramyces sp. JEL0728]